MAASRSLLYHRAASLRFVPVLFSLLLLLFWNSVCGSLTGSLGFYRFTVTVGNKSDWTSQPCRTVDFCLPTHFLHPCFSLLVSFSQISFLQCTGNVAGSNLHRSHLFHQRKIESLSPLQLKKFLGCISGAKEDMLQK